MAAMAEFIKNRWNTTLEASISGFWPETSLSFRIFYFSPCFIVIYNLFEFYFELLFSYFSYFHTQTAGKEKGLSLPSHSHSHCHSAPLRSKQLRSAIVGVIEIASLPGPKFSISVY